MTGAEGDGFDDRRFDFAAGEKLKPAVVAAPTRSKVNRALHVGYRSLNDGAGSAYHSLEDLYASIVASPLSLPHKWVAGAPARARRKYVLSSAAKNDLRAIWLQADQQEGWNAATAAIMHVVLTIPGLLTLLPYAGAQMHDLEGEPYCLPGRWAVYYRPANDGIEVIRVLDGRAFPKSAWFREA